MAEVVAAAVTDVVEVEAVEVVLAPGLDRPVLVAAEIEEEAGF